MKDKPKTADDYDDDVAEKYSEAEIREASLKLKNLVKELDDLTAEKEKGHH